MSDQPSVQTPTVAGALNHLARIAAIKDLVAEREAELRAFISAEADRVHAATGTAPRFASKGTGIAYITEPSARVVVTDDAAWGRWAREHHPDRVLHRKAIDATKLWATLEQLPELDDLLRRHSIVFEENLPEAMLEDEVAERFGHNASGAVCDPGTGELLPLVVTRGSRPTLTIRIDRSARERLKAQILDERALPELLRELPMKDAPVESVPDSGVSDAASGNRLHRGAATASDGGDGQTVADGTEEGASAEEMGRATPVPGPSPTPAVSDEAALPVASPRGETKGTTLSADAARQDAATEAPRRTPEGRQRFHQEVAS